MVHTRSRVGVSGCRSPLSVADDIYEVQPGGLEEAFTAEALEGEGIDVDIPGLWGVWGADDFIFDDYGALGMPGRARCGLALTLRRWK